MKLDVAFDGRAPRGAGAFAQAAEAAGFDTLWTSETRHDPFLPLAIAAERTERVRLGTAVAIAFARSPTVVAHTAWDLAAASSGRFILGLGTQVQAHIERRFGMPWSPPVPRLREYVEAVRAVWAAWQRGERLRVEGEHYRLTLMTPFFSPPPLPVPFPPVYIAGVGAPLARLAGAIADGFHVHPLHSRRYLLEVVRPAIAEGAARAGRRGEDVTLVAPAFYIPAGDAAAAAEVRAQIAFYASTPSYRGLLALHGWEQAGAELSARARRGEWARLPELIDEAMLAEFAVTARWDELPERLAQRYAGLVEHVLLYSAYLPGERDDDWRWLAAALAAPAAL